MLIKKLIIILAVIITRFTFAFAVDGRGYTVDVIHSIDSIRTAKKIDLEAEKNNKIQKILLQVNISREKSKSGADAENLLNITGEIAVLKNTETLGLMTIAPFTDDRTKLKK